MKTFHANFCHFTPQNWLLWQRPLTEVRQIFSNENFLINGFNATIRVEIRAPVVEWEGRQFKKKKENRW